MTELVAAAIEEAQILAAGRTLAKAFDDDPFQMHIFPDPQERAQRSPAQFSALVREGFLFGKAFATEGLVGISAWIPPGNTTTAQQSSQSGFRELPRLMGKAAFERFGRVLDYLSDAHREATPAEHWYLMVIGVLPERRGHGHGRALLKPIMAQADATGTPIRLDTAQPKVKTFYETLGFRPMIETVDPGSGLRFWTYQRDPA